MRDNATTLEGYTQLYNGKSIHIGLRHNYVRDLITNGVIIVDVVRSNQNLIDPLTKGLIRDLVNKTTKGMGLVLIQHLVLSSMSQSTSYE